MNVISNNHWPRTMLIAALAKRLVAKRRQHVAAGVSPQKEDKNNSKPRSGDSECRCCRRFAAIANTCTHTHGLRRGLRTAAAIAAEKSAPSRFTHLIVVALACLLPLPLAAQEEDTTAQEKPADAPLAVEAPATAEAEAPELTEEAEKAIERGLKFLIATQNKDGSWSSKDGEKEGGYAIAGTSLGLMAFMVEGHFPGFGRYGKALDRAKNYLLKRSKDSPTGAMGVKMYEIGLFTIAMSELWGMTSDPKDNKLIQESLERVVQIILRSQSPLGGWRYAPRPDSGQDTSVTAMVFVSLASAREAGVLVPTETIERLTGYLRDQAFDERRGGFGYQGKGYTIACTAGGVYAAQLAGNRDTEWVSAALNSLENDPKMFSRKDNGHFYYSHYYAMQAMVQAGEERYANWYPKIRDSLIALQKPNGSWQEQEMDYPHKTPMAIIILGTPNRYIPVYQR